ncbi:MAG: hypothetical protein ACLP6G_19575 [Terriglobales bacterium]
MSRDIKYIGMDVHKEAVVIAVLNGSGKPQLMLKEFLVIDHVEMPEPAS